MNQYSREWTNDEIDQLHKLLAEGYSGSEIGIKLERSRNSVLGKIMRIRDAGNKIVRPTVKRAPKPKPAKPSLPTKAEMAIRSIVKRVPPPVPTGDITILELSNSTCKYPMDKDLYCGATPYDGTPYCLYHAALCYNSDEIRRKANALGYNFEMTGRR